MVTTKIAVLHCLFLYLPDSFFMVVFVHLLEYTRGFVTPRQQRFENLSDMQSFFYSVDK